MTGKKQSQRMRRVPTILQMEATECGAASLAMVLASFGRYIPLEQLRVETGVSRDGSNAANLRRCAKKLGLDCRARKREAAQLRDLPMPCILHWEGNHFLVLEGFRGRFAWLNDPAQGRRRMTMEELADCFSGIVLTFEPTDSFEKQKKQRRVLPFLRQRLKGQGASLLRLLVIALLLLLPGAAVPVLSQVFVDDVLIAGHTGWLGRLLAVMGVCLLLQQGLVFYRACLLSRWQTQMSLMTGRGLLSHMLSLPISFFDQRYASDLVSRMNANDEICRLAACELAGLFPQALTLLFFLILMLIYSVQLALFSMACTGVGLLILWFSSRRMAVVSQKQRTAETRLYNALCGGVAASQSVKASGSEQSACSRLLGFHAASSRQEEQVGRLELIASVLPEGLRQLPPVLILMLTAPMIVKGSLTVGALLSFQLLYASFREPAAALMHSLERLRRLSADVLRVDDVLRYPREEEAPADERRAARLHGKLSGQVELKDVSFSYGPVSPDIVSDLSFILPSGSSVALVGASGCGKSTVGKLISGLYAPVSGQVLFDGLPMASIPRRILSASISTVSQQATLFTGSVRENLTMWNGAVLEQDMIRAAQDACIHDDIVQLPGGYDFRLEENGSNLSGGQRQRLQIARALVTNPSILVLDEATSALDPVTEQQVMENICRRGCTCVIAAHRLSTIRDCRLILVLQDGMILQQGDHDSLMKEEGLYRMLVGADDPGEVSSDV